MKYKVTLWTAGLVLICASVSAQDWVRWGNTKSRNMVGQAKNIPTAIKPGEIDPKTEVVNMKTTRNVKWVAKLGSQSYGNPTVADGRIYVGTNNESPRSKKYKGDRAAVFCLNEKDGSMIWQFNGPKLGAGKVSDWEFLGICSSPAVSGKHVYVVTNLCQVVCLDVDGLANGNQGYSKEGEYYAGKGKPPVKLDNQDADILWIYDMRKDLGIFPHNVTSSSVLVHGDYVYVSTSNGVDWSHVNIPNPRAPALIVLNKKTGKLEGEEVANISSRIMHCNWSSPSLGKVGKQEILLFGAGDGFLYGFDPKPVEDDGDKVLKELFRVDGNPPHYRKKNGKKVKYATPEGPSEYIASPVFHKGKVYIAIGQDPEHGEGLGNLICVDASKRGDITKSGVIWSYTKINRTISTVSVVDGLVFAADYAGIVHCLDAETGKAYWTHDTQSHIWASTLAVDGKVFIGNEDGYLTILKVDKKKKLLAEVEFDAQLYASPIVANDTLYVATMTHLYAIASTSKSSGKADKKAPEKKAAPKKDAGSKPKKSN